MKRDDSVRSFQYSQRRMSGASFGVAGFRNSLTINSVAQQSAYLTDKIAHAEMYVLLLIMLIIIVSLNVCVPSSLFPILLTLTSHGA